VWGMEFDVTVDSDRAKIIGTRGVVRVTRLSDGQVVDVKAGYSADATIETRDPLVPTRTTKPRIVWKAHLGVDGKDGNWVSWALALRVEIGEAVERGEIAVRDIRKVYGERLARIQEDDGFIESILSVEVPAVD